MSDTPETREAVERWRQGKINVFDEMARLERERDEARMESMIFQKEICCLREGFAAKRAAEMKEDA